MFHKLLDDRSIVLEYRTMQFVCPENELLTKFHKLKFEAIKELLDALTQPPRLLEKAFPETCTILELLTRTVEDKMNNAVWVLAKRVLFEMAHVLVAASETVEKLKKRAEPEFVGELNRDA